MPLPTSYWKLKTMPYYSSPEEEEECVGPEPENPCAETEPLSWDQFRPQPRFNFSKKIGMNLGIEYLVRSGLIREFMVCPCSIFVKSGDDKKVVTINKANIQNDEHSTLYCVRKWFVSDCDEQQPIPSMEESIVRDIDLFISPEVILRGYAPLYFDCSSVEWKRNRGNNGHPMPEYIYENYFHKMFTPIAHSIKREHFLWGNFTSAYIPAIDHIAVEDESYLRSGWTAGPFRRNTRRQKTPSYAGQQKLIERNFKNIWHAWLKWKKFMLFDTVPGELIFMRDYAKLS